MKPQQHSHRFVHQKNRLLILSILAINVTGHLSGQEVNVDIQGATGGGPGYNLNVGTYTGSGAAGTTGTQWNGIDYKTDNFSGELLDSVGSATDINMWFETADEWSYDVTPDVAGEALMTDYAFTTSGNTERFTIFSDHTSLTTSTYIDGTQAWDIYIYSQGDTFGQGGTITLNHAGGTTILSTTGDGSWDGELEEGANYVKFSNVVASAYDDISTSTNGFEFEVFWTTNGGSSAALNGIQLVTVPEPATTSMALGLGALVFMMLRRRQL